MPWPCCGSNLLFLYPLVVKVQLLLVDIERPAKFFAPVLTVTLNLMLAARILDGSLGYGSSVTLLPSTLSTPAGTGFHLFFLAFHCLSLTDAPSEVGSISSEKVTVMLVSRSTPLAPETGTVLSTMGIGIKKVTLRFTTPNEKALLLQGAGL